MKKIGTSIFFLFPDVQEPPILNHQLEVLDGANQSDCEAAEAEVSHRRSSQRRSKTTTTTITVKVQFFPNLKLSNVQRPAVCLSLTHHHHISKKPCTI